jgi:hypothetical protein
MKRSSISSSSSSHELPALAVFGAAVLAGQTRLEAARARDLAAHEHRVAGDRLRRTRGDDPTAVGFEVGDRRHVLHRPEGTVRLLGGPAAEHVGVRVAGDVMPAIAVAGEL